MSKESIIKQMKEKIYLGDGLYAHFDGYQIILSTPREFGEHYVALEPEVLNMFDQYRRKIEDLKDELKEEE